MRENPSQKVPNAILEKEGDITASKEFLDNLILACPDGIIGVNRKGIVIIFNEAAEKLTGLRARDVVGKLTATDVYQPPELAREIKKKLYSNDYGGVGRLFGLEVLVNGADGQKIPIRLSATLLFENLEEVGSVGFFHDLTETKQLEEELLKHSITDTLTELYNRRHFNMILEDETKRSLRYKRDLTLAFFDLDNFKPFNDTYGHKEGDNILRLVSKSMKSVLRKTDYAYRIGGDEFAFILAETDIEKGTLALERFRTGFNEQWPKRMSYLGTKLKPVTMSIGIAQFERDEKRDQFILRADLAMYEAKKTGGDCTVKASPEFGEKIGEEEKNSIDEKPI